MNEIKAQYVILKAGQTQYETRLFYQVHRNRGKEDYIVQKEQETSEKQKRF